MKVLIVGLGSIAQKHIAALKSIGEVEIFALRSSRSSVRYDEVKDLFSYEEISDFHFDFFIISNPTSKHAEAIKKLLVYKKPLFIEKPLFHSLDPVHEGLVKEIKELEITTYVACNLRFLEVLLNIKSLLEGAKVNEVNIYCGSYLPSWRPFLDFNKVYSSKKNLGGGVHLDLIHELDYLYWIFGKPEKVTSTFRSRSSLNIDAIDYANYLWEYEGFAANVVLNYFRRDTKRTLEIVTANDTFVVDIKKNRILKNDKEIFTSGQDVIDTYTSQMKFFIDDVLNGKGSNFNDVEEAYKVLNLCLKD